MLSTLLSQSSLQWHQVNIISNIIFVWDHPLRTSANFLDFWPLPPSVGSFFLLSVGKFRQCLTPSLKNASYKNEWSLWVVPGLSQGCPRAVQGHSKSFPRASVQKTPVPQTPHPIAYLVNWKHFSLINL